MAGVIIGILVGLIPSESFMDWPVLTPERTRWKLSNIMVRPTSPITGILLFNDTGTALMLTIFALQDSFGTACNATGDGTLTLFLTGYAEKHHVQ